LAESSKIVRAFLGSPGDLGDERGAAKAVADEINKIIANQRGCPVRLVRHENVVGLASGGLNGMS
jgi:hypothetical protein